MRLKLAVDALNDAFELTFNTKKVRLKQLRPAGAGARAHAFQYQKGAIKTDLLTDTLELRLDFNTKKVRLKPSSVRLRKCSTA